MKTYTFATSIALMAFAASANAITVATFDDPAADGSTPLFTVTDDAISGSWTGTGLTLEVPATAMSFDDVKMLMDPVTRTGDDLGAGIVIFYTDDVLSPIFTMAFNSGSIFEPFTSGSSVIAGDAVEFGGSALVGADPLINEQFSFSFANAVGLGSATRTYTAAMTSSADAVPEPATMALMGFGAAAIAARRRKKA